jgi:hypothetical protein
VVQCADVVSIKSGGNTTLPHTCQLNKFVSPSRVHQSIPPLNSKCHFEGCVFPLLAKVERYASIVLRESKPECHFEGNRLNLQEFKGKCLATATKHEVFVGSHEKGNSFYCQCFVLVTDVTRSHLIGSTYVVSFFRCLQLLNLPKLGNCRVTALFVEHGFYGHSCS